MRTITLLSIVLMFGLVGCSQQTSAPTLQPAPQPRPAAEPTPPPRTATAPRTTAANPPPRPTPPAPAEEAAPQTEAPEPEAAAATPEPEASPEPEAEAGEETTELPPYLKVLRQRLTDDGQLPSVALEGPRTVRIASNNATKMRITRRGLPLKPNGSIVLRIDHQVFEWTRQHQTLDLTFSPASGWAITARDGQPK